MKVCRIGGWGLVLWGVSGCGASQPAVATRALAVDVAALSKAPICFVPPVPSSSLTDRAQQLEVLRVCESAARAEGAVVLPFDGGHCLPTTMTWTTEESGDRHADCSLKYGGGAECDSTGIRRKSLKLTSSRAATGQPVAETTATIRSTYAGFSPESFHALCAAAFHDYPQPLLREQFNVSVD